MCTKEAVIEGWEKLSEREFKEIEGTDYDQVEDLVEGKGQYDKKKYVFNEKTETKLIDAQ